MEGSPTGIVFSLPGLMRTGIPQKLPVQDPWEMFRSQQTAQESTKLVRCLLGIRNGLRS